MDPILFSTSLFTRSPLSTPCGRLADQIHLAFDTHKAKQRKDPCDSMSSSRSRTPAPPPTPPKDTSSFINSSSYPSTHASTDSRYVNVDLAEAVRDSVHIRSEPKSSSFPPSLGGDLTNTASSRPSQPRRTPSALSPSTASTFQPSHSFSQTPSNMQSMAQPQLPSQRMATQTIQNPFEQDEVEPSGTGRVRPPGAAKPASGLEGVGSESVSRAKFNRAATG